MAEGRWADEPTESGADTPAVTGHWADEKAPSTDPIQQKTSASAAAVADNSWISPEFRSGKWYKDYVAPAAQAIEKAANYILPPLPPLTEEQKKRPDLFLPNQIGPVGGEKELPDYYQQAFTKTMTDAANMSPPKEAFPMHWYGRGVQNVAEILNPQGPPAARALRTGLQYFGGGIEKTSDAIAAMINPLNVGIMFAPELLPLRYASAAHKLLAAGFLVKAFIDTPQQWQRYQEAKTPQEKGGIVGETLISYAPAAGLFGRGKALAARRAGEEQKTTATAATADTGEAPPDLTITKDQFKEWVDNRLNAIAQNEEELTPEETANQASEARDLQAAAKTIDEGGDVAAVAAKFGVELGDVTPAAEAAPAEEGAAPAAETPAAETPAAEPAPAPQQMTADVARFKGQTPELMDRAAFIRAIKGHRDDLNAKSPLTDQDIADITEIDDALDAADKGQVSRIDELAREKYGVELSEGGEVSAQQPSDEKVPTTPAAPGEQEGTTGDEPPAGSGNNVVGETEGEPPGGTVPQQAATEPVEAPVISHSKYKHLNRKSKAGHDLTPEENQQVLDYEAARRAPAAAPGTGKLTPEELENLSHSQRAIYEETGKLLTPEEAAKAQTAKSRGPKLPANLEDALAGAEQSAIEGDKTGVADNIKEARRLLARSKGLSKDGRKAALNRIAMAEHTVKSNIPPSTAETADPNAVVYDGKTYRREGEYNGTGIWKHNGRLLKAGGRRTALDNIWEARKAIADTAKEEAAKAKTEKEKKAAAKPKAAAAPETTTEGQPAPGTKLQHWTWGEAEVVGPGDKPGTTKIRLLRDGMVFDVNTEALVDHQLKLKAPKAEVVDPAADLRKEIFDLQAKIIDDKNAAIKLKGKERVAANKIIRDDQLKLNKLKNKADKLPKAPVDTSALTERQNNEREMFRKSLQSRVKTEKFEKSQVVRPSSTGGEADVIPASSHRGLQIFKDKTNIKPWKVIHEGSGELLGHFDNQADAKAFAVRIHEGTKFDFTRPIEEVRKQITDYGSAKFREMVADPYSFLADAAARLKPRIDKDRTQGGFMMNDDIGPDVVEFGRRLYQRGTQFRDWAVNMVKHLGEKVIGALRSIWDSITGRNLLPGRGERGGASPGGGSLKGQGRQLSKDFFTRAEADAFIKANKSKFLSHAVIDQTGAGGMATVRYQAKPAPGSVPTKPIITKSGAVVMPKYNPTAGNAPAVVNSGTGGTIKPPPPGSALGPTPPGSNPHQVWWNRSISPWRKAWERYWPGFHAAFRMEPETVVGSTHQRWIQGPTNGVHDMFHSSWYKKVVQGLSETQRIDAEHDARTKFNAFTAAGQGELQATLNSIKGNPLRPYFIDQMNENFKEDAAAKRLNVKRPARIKGPYLPHLTDGENLPLIKIGGTREGVVSQLRRSLGHFEKSRVYESMKEGIDNGVNYRPSTEAIIQRRRVGLQLQATARALDDLEKGGVIYRNRADAEAYARATYKPKDVDVIRMDGFGGDTWWVRNRQEARMIDQNLNNSSPNSQWGQFMQIVNNFSRNPNLWNPAPHVTKNMFFKYVLARINAFTLKPDTPEFKRMTKPQLIDEYHSVIPMPGDQPGTTRLLHSERIPEMIAGESKKWSDKITRTGLALNRPSQKYIFEKADPWMRYKLWEYYRRKGKSAQEAGNHVLFDLIRYDENSGALNLYKSIPFNFFSTWRTGTYVTMYKAMKTHPIRTLMFFGAVEYLREMIYRKTGEWTHFPFDYIDSPLAQGVEGLFKAKRQVELGRSPYKAYSLAAGQVAGLFGTTAAFGPGGSQAPTTIKDLMGALQGDEAAMPRVLNMFWGLSQLFNMGGEFLQFKRDQKPEHLVKILTAAAFGTHTAISYEPRRLGKFIPEWMPGMTISDEMKNYANLRAGGDDIANKAAITHDRNRSIFNWANQGSKEQQVETLLRRKGIIKSRGQPTYPRSPRSGP